MTNLPKTLRQRLAAEAPIGVPEVMDTMQSADGETRKDLLRLEDGEMIEAVLMRYKRRRTACISTQVGCAIGCTFCATGRAGFRRDLTAGEIVAHRRTAKVLVFKKRRRKNSKRSRGHRQNRTLVRITEILTDGVAPKKAKTATAASKPTAATSKPAAATAGDDLKKLAGVGPAMEKKLNALGVTTFAEIAAWTTEDVARVEESLGSKGRIERDGWIGQAKKFAAGEDQE